MKPYVKLAAVFTMIGTVASADAFSDKIIANLQDLGYEYIEIRNGPTQVKVEAIRGDSKLEVIYDRESGVIIEREVDDADPEDTGKSGVSVRDANSDFSDDDEYESEDEYESDDDSDHDEDDDDEDDDNDEDEDDDDGDDGDDDDNDDDDDDD